MSVDCIKETQSYLRKPTLTHELFDHIYHVDVDAELADNTSRDEMYES